MKMLKSKPLDKEFPGDLLQIIENYIVGTYPIERSKFSKESLEDYLPESSALDLKRLLIELELDEYAGVAARRLKSENGKKELLDNLEQIINQLEKE